MEEMIKTFKVSQSVKTITALFSILGVGVFLLEFMREGFNFNLLLVFLLILLLCLWINLDLRTTVISDEEKINIEKWTGLQTFKWDEIADFQCSPRLISFSSIEYNKKAKFFRGEYGISLEPFSELQNEVTNRAGRHLLKEWKQLKLPITLVYPGISLSTFMVYLIPIGLIFTFSTLFTLGSGGQWLGNFLFLFLCLLVLAPFFIRDLKRSSKKLILDQTGLRQVNGKEIYLPWQAVTKIIVKEPLSVGYGSIVVESENDGRIWIPRSLMKCGQVLYLIKRETKISETYDHEN